PPAASASLSQYLHFLWRRKLSIVLCVVVAAGAAYGVASGQEPRYESSTELLFGASGTGTVDSRVVSIPTEARVVTSPAVLEAAAEKIDGSDAPDVASLEAAVEAEQAGDIAVLRITARHQSPTTAAEIAEAVSETYLDKRDQRAAEAMAVDSAAISDRLAELSTEIERLARQVAAHEAAGRADEAAVASQQMSVLSGEQTVQRARLYELGLTAARADRDASVLVPASVPDEPVAPRPLRAAVIGGLVGLLAGLGLAMAREHVGSAVRQVSEIEAALAVPVLATVPMVSRSQRKRAPVAVLDGATSHAAEAYRILRANLAAAGVGDELGVLVVTSAVGAEGKSTTAANLAAAFAETGVDTLLVDGDLRRPQLHRLFNRPNDPGLTSLLTEEPKPPEMSLLMEDVRVGRHLWVLPAGPSAERPAQMVASPQLAPIVAAFRATHLVVIDGPPVLPVADVGALTAVADAVLVVVRPELVRRTMLLQLGARMVQLGAPVLGAVVNAPDRSSFETGSGYGYYYYGSATTPSGNGNAGALAKFIRTNR
ncbi:MAG: polysaccharide biosynthesis tyrosine autokinase, partial [Actinobacteria bacterium]|nr:polysaccharide biosynthesis tyrosine autokinase [Actinomycetota bacterium]